MIRKWQEECLEYEAEKNEMQKRQRAKIDNDDIDSDGVSEIVYDDDKEEIPQQCQDETTIHMKRGQWY